MGKADISKDYLQELVFALLWLEQRKNCKNRRTIEQLLKREIESVQYLRTA